MKHFPKILLLLFIFACNSNNKPPDNEIVAEIADTAAKSSNTLKQENTLASDTVTKEINSFPATWTSLDAIQHKWIMLERDEKGYLVYVPCNGETPRIYIESGYVTVFWQLEAPSKFSIDKFTRLKGNKSFYVYATEKDWNMEFTAEIKDVKRKLVLWTFGDFKWVMTPIEFMNDFRQVKNPCPNEMKAEKQFLPVEY
ncbi:MAG: hypothetical protein K9J13_12845 [Saprospiraceae bacterium]|nr:hypothetical protein [Saprospiraceae bacterium]